MNKEITKEEISLKELILSATDWYKYFVSKWKIILPVAFLFSTIGFLLAYYDKPIYHAELIFALDDKGSGGNVSGIASQLGLDIGGGSGGSAFSGDNNLQLMKSRNIVERALLSDYDFEGKKQTLINRFIEFNQLNEEWVSDPDHNPADIFYTSSEPRSNYTRAKDSILYWIYKDLKDNSLSIEKVDKKLTIVIVSFESEDEIFAKAFVETLIKTASDFYVNTKTKKARLNLEVLEARLDSVKKALNIEIFGAALSKDKSFNVIRAQGSVESSKKALNVQILTTMYTELVKNAEFAKYALMREEPMIQLIDTPILPLEKTKFRKIKGIIGGGFLGGFLAMAFFTFKRLKLIIMTD